jgi:SAM-dependent methyltransferase
LALATSDRARWEDRYRTGSYARSPSSLVRGLDDVLPRAGRALDVAGGAGRHAVWLAERGLSVTLVDVSETALELCERAADDAAVSVRTVLADMETDPLPPGPWDVVLAFHYLWRPLMPALCAALASGGMLVVVQPTRSNLRRHPHPREAFLLDDGELPSLVGDLEVVSYEEGWLEEGRHEARLVARRR